MYIPTRLQKVSKSVMREGRSVLYGKDLDSQWSQLKNQFSPIKTIDSVTNQNNKSEVDLVNRRTYLRSLSQIIG